MDLWKLVGPLVSVYRLVLFFSIVYRFSDPPAPVHSVAFSVDHLGTVPVYDDELRWGVLPTSTHLWLCTVHHSYTWRTVVPTKASVVAETSTKTIIKGCNLMNLLELIMNNMLYRTVGILNANRHEKLRLCMILLFCALQVVKGLLKFWPKTCSQKEVGAVTFRWLLCILFVE